MKMTLNIEPKPQTRPRFSKFGTYEDPKMKAWRRQCSQLIEQEYDGFGWVFDCEGVEVKEVTNELI